MTATAEKPTLAFHGLMDEEIPKLWDWMNSPREAQFDDFGPKTFGAFEEEILSRPDHFMIDIGGKMAGYLGFARLNPVSVQFRGLVIDPAQRRQGIGIQAMMEAIEDFKRKGVTSFLSMPFVDNAPIKKLLLKCGFQCTGTIPGATRRNGEPLGVSVYHLEVK